MGKQIAPEDAMFKGEASAAMSIWSTSISKAARTASTSICSRSPKADSAGRPRSRVRERRAQGADRSDAAESDLDFLLDEPRARRRRRTDARARSAGAHAGDADDRIADARSLVSDDAREGRQGVFAKAQAEQTAELSLDDLGLDVDALEQLGLARGYDLAREG